MPWPPEGYQLNEIKLMYDTDPLLEWATINFIYINDYFFLKFKSLFNEAIM